MVGSGGRRCPHPAQGCTSSCLPWEDGVNTAEVPPSCDFGDLKKQPSSLNCLFRGHTLSGCLKLGQNHYLHFRTRPTSQSPICQINTRYILRASALQVFFIVVQNMNHLISNRHPFENRLRGQRNMFQTGFIKINETSLSTLIRTIFGCKTKH